MAKSIILLSLVILLGACSGNAEKNQPVAGNAQNTENPGDTIKTKTPSKPVHLNEESFKTLVFDYQKGGTWKLAGDKPCIIDFYADWCRPCRIIAPYMEEFAAEYEGRVNIYKVNTDHNPKIAAYFNIQSIPAVMFCPLKGDPTMTVGAYPKEEYTKLIGELLLK